MDFKKLKKQSANIDKLTAAIDKDSSNFKQDERYWQPTVDKAGNGYAVIRFLPAPPQDGEDSLPWVKYFSHGFQGPGGWYIENSLTSISKDDPVSEYNTKLWNSGSDANKEVARKQKRKLHYVSNIYVVSDPKHPENEGKVFLFSYGKKIFDKIKDAMNPPEEFEDEKPVDVFSFWEGANFKLKIRKVEGYRNYDKSEFEKPSPLLGGDDKKLEEVWKTQYSLLEIVDEKNFKDYATLKTRLDRVLGFDSTTGMVPAEVETNSGDAPRTAESVVLSESGNLTQEEEDVLANLDLD